VNRRPTPARTSNVAAASVGRRHGDDSDLAHAVHQVLATLADVRGDTPAAELIERLTLVRWLRGELAAVETLLAGAHGRRVGAADLGTDHAV
jgi:hypothetical protein